MLSSAPRTLARLWILLFAVFALGLPILNLLRLSSFSGLLDPLVLAALRVTLLQATLSALISCLVGLPLGLLVGGRSRAGELLLALPYGVPTVAVAIAAVAWMGRSGIAPSDWLYSMKAVVLVHVILNAPLVALWVSRACAAVDPSAGEVVRTLGGGTAQVFRHVLWPAIRAAFGSAGVQVFTLCSMSFVLVLLLGGGPPVQTLETAIYSSVRGSGLDLSAATAFAFWQLVLGLVPWILLGAISRRQNAVISEPSRMPALSAARRRLAVVFSAAFVVPYLVLVDSGTLARWSSPDWYSEIAGPLRLSFILAAAVSCLAVMTASCGIYASRGSRAERAVALLFSVPGGISALVLGLALWRFYAAWIDPFEGSLAAIAVLQAILFCPIAFRAFWPVSRSRPESALEEARALGASGMHLFRFIEWPRWRGTVLITLAMIAGASLGEVAAVSFFYSERLIPLPLLVTRYMARYRFEDARALAAFLMVLSFAIIALVHALGQGGRNMALEKAHE